MTKAAIWSLLIIATAASIAGLVFFRETLTEISMAVLLFLGVGGVARWIKRRIPALPRWGAGLLAVALILSVVGVIASGIIENARAMLAHAAQYQSRIDQISASLFYSYGGHGTPPTLKIMLAHIDAAQTLAVIAGAVENLTANALFIVIYLGFLLAASFRFTSKLDQLYAVPANRTHAANVLTAIRKSMEQYLWMQTVVSLITSVLTYLTLVALGLDHALFWASLIFLLNYIPTIGAIVGFVLPTLFALVQFPDLARPALIGVSIFAWHFVIGHWLQPRMMGKSLNLSPLVVLLSLELWGHMWGLAGAFLAAPLMTMLMIVLAQFSNSRWISIILSGDGQPSMLAAQHGGETEADVQARLHPRAPARV